MCKIFISVLMLVGSFLALAEQESPAPRIEPTNICPETYLRFIFDPEMPLGLAVRAKNGRFFYLADPIMGTVIPYYWNNSQTKERADMLVGLFMNSEEGHMDLTPVFTEPGVYEFYFSDNLHTEPENAIFITRKVTYLGPDHPDCSKPPFN